MSTKSSKLERDLIRGMKQLRDKVKPIPAHTRRTPQGPVLSVSVDAAKLEPVPPKPARVRRPRSKHGWSINSNSLGTYVEHCGEVFAYDYRYLRSTGEWFLRSAAWIEQQQKGGKR